MLRLSQYFRSREICTVYPSQPNKHFKRNFSVQKHCRRTNKERDKIINQILCTGTFARCSNIISSRREGARVEYGKKRNMGIRSDPRAQFHVQQKRWSSIDTWHTCFHIKTSFSLYSHFSWCLFSEKKRHEKREKRGIKTSPSGQKLVRAALWNCGCKQVCKLFWYNH